MKKLFQNEEEELDEESLSALISFGIITLRLPFNTIKFTRGFNILLHDRKDLNAIILIEDAGYLDEIYREYSRVKDKYSELYLEVHFDQIVGNIPYNYIVNNNWRIHEKGFE